MARLLSVNVGLPRVVSWQGEKVFTSVWKQSVQGGRKVRRLNVDGDGQGDLSGHGGEHRAVLVYQMDSYRYWEQQLGRTDFTFGQISFTRSGLTVAWRSDRHSLLDLAEVCDVPVRWSCRTGVCHTCECALIGGAIDYLPEPLEPPAEGNVLICCSRPRGDIEIDL